MYIHCIYNIIVAMQITKIIFYKDYDKENSLVQLNVEPLLS